MQSQKAVLAVSFGTSVDKARQEAIVPVENALRRCAGLPFYTAYTSPTVRRVLEKRGVLIPDLSGALEQMERDGVREALVQPTHLLYGYEYEKIQEIAARYAPRFAALRLGSPLLASTGDLLALSECLSDAYPAREGNALVLLGHGTAHIANTVYPALQMALRLSGRADILVGTAEGWPGFDEVLSQLEDMNPRRVRMAPLMLVAGEHALHDMAGEQPDSWRARLTAAGRTVACSMTGLGALPGVQSLYCAHLKELLQGGLTGGNFSL